MREKGVESGIAGKYEHPLENQLWSFSLLKVQWDSVQILDINHGIEINLVQSVTNIFEYLNIFDYLFGYLFV